MLLIAQQVLFARRRRPGWLEWLDDLFAEGKDGQTIRWRPPAACIKAWECEIRRNSLVDIRDCPVTTKMMIRARGYSLSRKS